MTRQDLHDSICGGNREVLVELLWAGASERAKRLTQGLTVIGLASDHARANLVRSIVLMDRRRIASGSSYEPVIGFSRAIVAGRHVAVSATAPIMPDGAEPPPDAYGQARRCLEIILEALREADAGPEQVVRTRCYLVDADDWQAVGRAHGEVFGEIRPASTMVVVVGFIDPRWRLEIEADAMLDG